MNPAETLQGCPVCLAATEQRTRMLLPDLTTATCGSCGLITAQFPRATAGYERIDMAKYEASIGRMRRDEAPEHVRMVQGSHMRTWLDVGCGIGAVLREAQDAGYIVVGTEPDPIARHLANEALQGTAVIERFDSETVPDGSQGVISMLDVLEHLPPSELGATAELVHKKLSQEGYWLIKVPSSDGLFYKVADAISRIAPYVVGPILRRLWLTAYAWPHRSYFSESNLRRYLENYGFTATSVRYLAAMPQGTILNRLRLDATIPLPLALMSAPLAWLFCQMERSRRRTDCLVLLARKVPQRLSASA